MAVVLCPFFMQFFDDNGDPLNGGKVYTYAAGTSTPKATFTDFTENTSAANPVVLDPFGRTTMWISGAYKFVLTDSLGNVIRTTDNVSAFSVPAASANAYFQEFSGNGVQTAFVLSQDLGTDENGILAFVNSGGWIPKNPNEFTLTSGGSPAITFTVAPPNAASNIRIYAPSLYLGAASAAAQAAATSEANAAASATLASQWASQTSGIVAATDFSAKAWAIGGTGVTTTSGKGAAKEWAITVGGAVDTSEFSAKEYAIGTTVTAGSSKSWATVTGSVVASSEYSAKEYAQGTTVPTGSSKDWAQKTSATVDGAGFSAKEFAQGTQAATGGSSKNWAQQTGADVTGAAANSRSAKSWSQDNLAGATLGGSAKDWAQSASLPDGTLKSAKSYAADAAASALQFQGTSTDSIAIATGVKAFTTQTGKLFNGENVRVYSAANSANYMDGLATYSGTSLSVNVGYIGGTGTFADWVIKVNGNPGAQGASGTGIIWGGTVAGTANALTLTPSPALGAYAAGLQFEFTPVSTNTSSPTINVSGLGAVTTRKSVGGGLVALVAGDLQNGVTYSGIHDGTFIVIQGIRAYSQGADIASATTTSFASVTGDYVNVTGTTTITAITLSQGRQVTVQFSGILTLTNGASLILPGGASITTAAGDTAVFRGEASNVVRCVAYQKASGAAVVSASSTPPTRQVLTSGTAATYTTPANCKVLRVRIVGGGAGGGGSSPTAADAGTGGTGGTTSFGSWTAIGGTGGASEATTNNGGAGGTGGASGTGTTIHIPGGGGMSGNASGVTGTQQGGGVGGSSPFGGAGVSTHTAGVDASANSGSGGSGANQSKWSSGGGGAGEYVEFLIAPTPSATYTYTIGAGGAAGTAGTGGRLGGVGGSGVAIVDEYY